MRHISQVERIALRDHEAIAEARREYEPDVTRIAAAMLGSYAQNQVVHTVASVFAVLWDQAHRLDPSAPAPQAGKSPLAGGSRWPVCVRSPLRVCSISRRTPIPDPHTRTLRVACRVFSGTEWRTTPTAGRRPPPAGTPVRVLRGPRCDGSRRPCGSRRAGSQTGGRACQTDCYMERFYKSLPADGALRLGHAGPRPAARRGTGHPDAARPGLPSTCRTAVHPLPNRKWISPAACKMAAAGAGTGPAHRWICGGLCPASVGE